MGQNCNARGPLAKNEETSGVGSSGGRAEAARELGEMVTAEMTAAYPDLVETSAPSLPL